MADDPRKALVDLLRWRSTPRGAPKPPPKPLKTSREALLALVCTRRDARGRVLRRALTAEDVVDRTLEAIEAFAYQHLQNDWTGGEVLHQLKLWRKTR